MLELHNIRPDDIKEFNVGTSKITKFTNQTLDDNGQARNYDFNPEYNLILYVYSVSPKITESFKEYNVQYGYMYYKEQIDRLCFPVFREVPTDDKRKVGVWKASCDNWDEFEVVKVSTNYYAYSLVENRDLSRFLDSAIKVIVDHKEKLTEKYNKDMTIQNNICSRLVNDVLKAIDNS